MSGGAEGAAKSDELTALKSKLRAESAQKDALTMELVRLKSQLNEVEARELAAVSQQKKELSIASSQIHELTKERNEATDRASVANETQKELQDTLKAERERVLRLQSENQRLQQESGTAEMHQADMEEVQMRLQQAETEKKSFARQLEEAEKRQAQMLEEQHSSAIRMADLEKTIAEKERELEDAQQKIDDRDREIDDLNDEVERVKELSMSSSSHDEGIAVVPKLSLQTFEQNDEADQAMITNRNRGASFTTYAHFSRPEETPRGRNLGETEMTSIPMSTSSHRRTSSLDSLDAEPESDFVPLNDHSDSRNERHADAGGNSGTKKEEKKDSVCPCVIS